jgi:hypothetical protein
MSETPAFLAKRLEAEGKKTADFFSGLSDEQWKTQVYTEGDTWTLRNILAHFVTTEQGFLKLFASILEGGEGVPENFSIDRNNASQQDKTREIPPGDLLNLFLSVREQMVSWVSDRSSEELALEGRHPFLGQVKLGDMVKMIYRHNQIHFRDFRHLIR